MLLCVEVSGTLSAGFWSSEYGTAQQNCIFAHAIENGCSNTAAWPFKRLLTASELLGVKEARMVIASEQLGLRRCF